LSHLKKEEMTLDLGGHANDKGSILVANELLKKLKLQELTLNKLC
jgi:lysophospholipase L1-like esterase